MSNSLDKNVIVEIPAEAHVSGINTARLGIKRNHIDKKGHSRPICVTIGKVKTGQKILRIKQRTQKIIRQDNTKKM